MIGFDFWAFVIVGAPSFILPITLVVWFTHDIGLWSFRKEHPIQKMYFDHRIPLADAWTMRQFREFWEHVEK